MQHNRWDQIISKVGLPRAENSSAEFVRRMDLTNFIVVACFVVNVIGIVFDYFLVYNEQLLMLDLIGVVFFGVLLAVHWKLKKQVFTAALLFLSLLLYIGYSSVLFGKEVFIILYLFNLVIASFFMFDIRSLVYKSLLILAVCSVFWLEIFGFDLGLQIPFTPEELINLRVFCIVVNVILFVVMVVIMDRGIRRVEIALISKRKKVAELSDRLQMLCNLKEEYNTSLLHQRDSLLMNKGDLKSISGLTSIRSEERERARIGKELSQSVGELLIKFKLRMGNLSPFIEAKDRSDFEDTLRIIDMARDEIARVSEVLDPIEFHRMHLDEAMRAHIKKLKAHYQVSIDFLNVGYKNQLTKEQELVVYRVVSEMLSVMVENERMVHCDVRMEVVEYFMTIRIQAETESAENAAGGLWLKSSAFQDRIQIIGGFVHHKIERNKGNTILIEIPVPDYQIISTNRNAS